MLAVLLVSLLTGCCNHDAIDYSPVLRDAWPVSTPAEQGLDPELVTDLYCAAQRQGTLYSLLVIKNGILVAEGDYNEGSIDQRGNGQSATKSFTSALVGLAIEDGCLSGVDARMLDFFSEYTEIEVSARDMARFGQTYLDGGVYDGQQVLPAEWVQASLSSYSTVTGPLAPGPQLDDYGYGYRWWSATADEHHVDFAWGHGGQFIVATAYGGPEVLEWVEEEMPQPEPGQVRIRVLAAGVPAYDLMVCSSGLIPDKSKPPFTPGLDVVGSIEAVGEGGEGWRVGQRVAAGTFQFGYGGYAEHLCVPTEALVLVPPGVDPAEAVCLVVNYPTAWTMLHEGAQVHEGEQVLIHGAAGGVGSAMLELGWAAGLEMIGTAWASKHALLEELGATPADYRSEDVVQRVRQLTGDGVDAVFDPGDYQGKVVLVTGQGSPSLMTVPSPPTRERVT